jgi:hypothetical protein
MQRRGTTSRHNAEPESRDAAPRRNPAVQSRGAIAWFRATTAV